MCGRSSLTKTEKELEQRFRATFYSEDLERYNPLPRYNIAPTQLHPVITQEDPGHFHMYRWGLVPFWAKDIKIGVKMINARIETLAEKPAFKYAFQKRRCLVPFDGYYEWLRQDGHKIPYRICRKDREAFATAGLYETWKAPDGKDVHSFTVITREADPAIAHIHDRMPFMLEPEHERAWLDAAIPARDLLFSLPPIPGEDLEYYEVSTRVNKATEEDAELVKPV